MPKFSLSEKAKKRAEKIRSTKAAATPQMETSVKPPKVNKPKKAPKPQTPKPKSGTLFSEKGEMAGRRITVEKQISEAARQQAAGKTVTKPVEPATTGRRIGAARKVKAAAAVQQAGAPVTRKIVTEAEKAAEHAGKRVTVEKAVQKRATRWASVQQKGLIKVTRPQPETTTVGRRITTQRQIRAAAEAQQTGAKVTKPTTPRVTTRQFKMVTPAPSAAERARQAHAGRSAFHAEKARMRPPTPTAPKGPGLGARISEKLRKPKMPRIGSAKHLREGWSPFAGPTPEGAGWIRKATGVGGRLVAPAVRRVLPGAVAGASLLAQHAEKKGASPATVRTAATVGAAAGTIVSTIAPKIATRAALPLSVYETVQTTYKASKEYKKAKEAYKHLGTHARGLKKAGYRVRQQSFGPALLGLQVPKKEKGGFLGGATFKESGVPGIRLQKVSEGQYTPGVAPPWARKKGKK